MIDGDFHYIPDDALKPKEGKNPLTEEQKNQMSGEFVQETVRKKILDLFLLAERFSLQSLLSRFSDIKDALHLSEEVIQEIGREAFLDRLQHGDVNSALKIKIICNLSEDFIQPIVQKEFLDRILKGFSGTAFSIKTCFNFLDDFFQLPEIQEALQNQFFQIINSNYVNNPYPRSQGGGEITSVDDAFQFQMEFKLPEKFVRKTAQDACLDKIKNGYNYLALEIIKQFKLSEHFLQLAEVQKFIENQSLK